MTSSLTRRELARLVEQRAAHILSLLATSGALPLVPLSDYPTAADYLAICGPPHVAGWSWRTWRQVNEGVIEALRNAGVRVQLAPLTAAEFLPWLEKHGLSNTPENRAQYVQIKISKFKIQPL